MQACIRAVAVVATARMQERSGSCFACDGSLGGGKGLLRLNEKLFFISPTPLAAVEYQMHLLSPCLS
jgi:hypothetical protein